MSDKIEGFYYYFPSLGETKESEFSDIVFNGESRIPDSLDVKEVLEYAYDNNDGWEWMPDYRSEQTIVLVDEAGNEYEFGWILEFSPDFSVQKLNE